jgi:RNA polymerase sigma factor (TIGR02999 family)
MQGQPPDHTLQPTALINEAYLRLMGGKEPQWDNRAHFFAAAASAMRSILVDHARARHAQKRGGGRRRESLSEAVDPSIDRAADVLSVHEALGKLETIDPRKSRTVELLFFGGLSVEETAAVLGSSPRTVKRDWRFARAWLSQAMER